MIGMGHWANSLSLITVVLQVSDNGEVNIQGVV